MEKVEAKVVRPVKIKLRCGSGGNQVIEKELRENELKEMTMENLLDDFINTNWTKSQDKSEMSYIDSQTKNREKIFAAYFVNGQRIPVYLSARALDCLADVRQRTNSDEFEICFLK